MMRDAATIILSATYCKNIRVADNYLPEVSQIRQQLVGTIQT